MKTGTEHSSSTASTILDSCLYPFRKISAGFWYVLGDFGKLARYQEDFIFGELADRSVESKEGYSETYIGLPFLRAQSFFIFTGEKYLKAAAEFGEYIEDKPEDTDEVKRKNAAHFDPEARSLFDPLKKFLGMKSIINMNGPEVKQERAAIMQSLSISRARKAAWDISDQQKQNWSDQKSLNTLLSSISVQIIAAAWFNIDTIPEELIPLLKKAEYYVFNRHKVSNADFEKLREQIEALNQVELKKQEAKITSGPSYLTYLKEDRSMDSLAKLNAFAALLVEGNITTVLMGAVLQLATNINLQERLRKEINAIAHIDLRSKEGYYAIKELPLLNQIYLESLRYYSPAAPIGRKSSRAGEVNGLYIPPRSYLFIPLRRIMHDPKLWTHPEQFDPSRFASGNLAVGQYPLKPYSDGLRKCPASYGFAEAAFKITLVNLFKDHELKLTSHAAIEHIPVATKEARFKQQYKGNYREVVSEASTSSEAKSPLRFGRSSQDVSPRQRRNKVETSLPNIDDIQKVYSPTLTKRLTVSK